MIYAPILITTLNRHEHFKRLVESLKMNSWAEKTDIYISVDYPLSLKYKDGYDEIKKYLRNEFKEFNSFNVFYQKKNLSPYGNFNFLLERIKEKGFDRYIFLEDDNEASHNFIEYMDKGLEKFEKDDSVIGICGNDRVIMSNEFVNHGEGNYRFSRYLTYGLATWMSVNDILYEKCQNGDFIKMVYSSQLMLKLFKVDRALYRRYIVDLVYRNPIYYYKDILVPIDTVYNIYMALFDKVVVVPNLSKMRNYGLDGSGVGGIRDEELADGTRQILDLDDHFNFDDHKPYMNVDENKFISDKIRENTRSFILYPIMHIFYCVLGRRAILLKECLIKGDRK